MSRGDWFYDDVKFVYNQNLMVGVSETRFAPNATANRAMIATVLYRLAGTPRIPQKTLHGSEAGLLLLRRRAVVHRNGIFEGYGNGKIWSHGRRNPGKQLAAGCTGTEKYLDMDASSPRGFEGCLPGL